jgi:hypothetical protein
MQALIKIIIPEVRSTVADALIGFSPFFSSTAKDKRWLVQYSAV